MPFKSPPPPDPTKETLDLSHVDLDAFLADLAELRRGIEASLGEADLAHLRSIERVGRVATAVGMATAWMGPNPVSMIGLSLGRSTRWLLMHHIGHRGYDKVPNAPARYTSRVFARGRRRFLDWADWMLPEAWIYEHNVLHHGYTGEERDPDLIERNTRAMRESSAPRPLKYLAMAGLAVSWRASYYAPNTLRVYREKHGEAGRGDLLALLRTSYLPYGALMFAAIPAVFLPLGPLASLSALVNSLGAEALTNLHTFLVVGPNHTGDDLFRFDEKPSSKAETMLRQVLGSVNYRTGGDLVDFAHLWLNYQIEHHLFPDLPMLRYREVAPKVKALCEEHGIPYVQEGVMARARKMIDVAVGKTTMRRGLRLSLKRGSRARASESSAA